jgi:hypothetical protein
MMISSVMLITISQERYVTESNRVTYALLHSTSVLQHNYSRMPPPQIILLYFPAHKTHFSPRKMWPKFILRLMRRG